MVFEAFEGLVSAAIANDPADSGNLVAMYVKGAAGQPWAGATLYTTASNKSVPRVGLNTSKTVTLRVYSPAAGENIRLKLEDAADSTHTIEVDAVTTVANAWQTLTFDFTTPASGTAAYNSTYTYNKVSIFPKFLGAVTTNKTYYFDELKYSTYSAPPTSSGTTIIFSSNYSAADADTVSYTRAGRSTEGGAFNWYQDASANDWSNFWWNGIASADSVPSFYFGVGLPSTTPVPYIGAFVNAPSDTSITLSGQTKLRIAVWGNDELVNRRLPTFTPIIQLKQNFSGCFVEAKAPAIAPALNGAQTYTLNLTDFTIKNNCAGSGITTVAQLLAQPIGSVHVQVLKANMYFSGTAASPNGINFGPVSFIQ
jgi:hypothetical protein